MLCLRARTRCALAWGVRMPNVDPFTADASVLLSRRRVTDGDWRSLAEAALHRLELDVARKAFVRLRDLKSIELVDTIEVRFFFLLLSPPFGDEETLLRRMQVAWRGGRIPPTAVATVTQPPSPTVTPHHPSFPAESEADAGLGRLGAARRHPGLPKQVPGGGQDVQGGGAGGSGARDVCRPRPLALCRGARSPLWLRGFSPASLVLLAAMPLLVTHPIPFPPQHWFFTSFSFAPPPPFFFPPFSTQHRRTRRTERRGNACTGCAWGPLPSQTTGGPLPSSISRSGSGAVM